MSTDMLRFSRSKSGSVFAGHDNWSQGFCNESVHISLPPEESLALFLVSFRQYELSIEGDATLMQAEHCEMKRRYQVDWSDHAKQLGTGSATVKIVNPDCPAKPSALMVSMGEFSYCARTQRDKVESCGLDTCQRVESMPLAVAHTRSSIWD